MLEKGFMVATMKPVVETTEEELYRYISCLVLKTSTRRCLVGVLNENLLSALVLPRGCGSAG